MERQKSIDDKTKEVFSNWNYTSDYCLGRVHFVGRVRKKGQVFDRDRHSLDGGKDLRRILDSVDGTGSFSIIPEDSHEFYAGAECSGNIESVTYYNHNLPPMDASLNIPFEDFLKIGGAEVIKRVVQLCPVNEKSRYLA